MSILIKKVELDGRCCDIGVRGNRISAIGEVLDGAYDEILDGENFIARPAFYNLHAHSAMTLLRGYADDLELMDWLNNHIWPAEAKLTPEDIYIGTKLACMEMLHTGIVGFMDMYFKPDYVSRAASEVGLRGWIGSTTIDVSPKCDEYERDAEAFVNQEGKLPERIHAICAPHAIYTVSAENLKKYYQLALDRNLLFTLHLAETAYEEQQCRREHQGMSPVEYVDSLGILSERTILAHMVHLSDSDIEIIAKRRAVCVMNPCSNLKLCSGLFPFRKLLDAGCRVCLGTDGTASNNNLSMFDEMKMAAMVAKLSHQGPLGCSAQEIYQAATENGADALGLDAGKIEVGKLADIILLDRNDVSLIPNYNIISNLVYSADTRCVKTVICDGRILMRNSVIPGEDDVKKQVRECVKKFQNR